MEVFYDALGEKVEVQSDLVGNGDFRSQECIELLKECDIVVTNPPFSLFREYILQLIEYDKKFLIIGNPNTVTAKNVFNYIKNDIFGCGITRPREFKDKKNNIIQIYAQGFSNLEHGKRYKGLELKKNYNEINYPKYDNLNIINVDCIKDIPCDYYGLMGVPLTIIEVYNPKQFKILGREKEYTNNIQFALLNGIKKYVRIIIQRKEIK